MAKTQSTKRVLAYVNKLRRQMHLKPLTELPKGEVGSSHSCPIAMALKNGMGVSVTGGEIELSRSITPPEFIGEFIEDFDNGEYPELVKGKR